MGVDENVVAVVAASCRAGTFSALTRDEHTDLVRSIILAYEAAIAGTIRVVRRESPPITLEDDSAPGAECTCSECVDAAAATEPVAPMSTSGEMIMQITAYLLLRDEMVTDPDERTDDERMESAKEIFAIVASRIEALEALVREQAAALVNWKADSAAAWNKCEERRLAQEAAEAALAKAEPK
jgi:hypothetical protein